MTGHFVRIMSARVRFPQRFRSEEGWNARTDAWQNINVNDAPRHPPIPPRTLLSLSLSLSHVENCLRPGTSTREVRETLNEERWNRIREGANFLEWNFVEDVEGEEKLNGARNVSNNVLSFKLESLEKKNDRLTPLYLWSLRKENVNSLRTKERLIIMLYFLNTRIIGPWYLSNYSIYKFTCHDDL